MRLATLPGWVSHDDWPWVWHDFWCQVAIVALLHYGATFGGLYDDEYDSYEQERR